MLTSMSRMLVDGAILFSLSSSGSTLPSQEVTSDRSELSFCHCSRSCLMSAAFLCACSSSQRSITPEETRKRDEYVYKCYLPHTHGSVQDFCTPLSIPLLCPLFFKDVSGGSARPKSFGSLWSVSLLHYQQRYIWSLSPC